jgi:CheY-like chemotaxis protein
VKPRRKAEEHVRLVDLRILIVDDDEATRESVAEMLDQAGAKVRTVPSAAEAMAAVPEFRPEILLCDIGMPHEDGYTLIRRMRALAPDMGGSTPAIALTALAGEEDRRRALGAGFQMHLAKPVDIDRLSAAVVETWQRHQKETRSN